MIRLNLLAEDQAAEELRRRDPVKRALWLAGLLVSLMLAWSGYLQLRAWLAGRDLGAVERQISVRTNDFQQVLEFQTKSIEIESKLAALRQLAANRFLNGTLLNALQQTTLENVQLIGLRMEHAYTATEETKPKTSPDSSRLVPGRPATATEKLRLVLDAEDFAPNPGDEITRFRALIASHPYFQTALLGSTNEVKLIDRRQVLSQPDGKLFLPFTLECRYPEKTR